METHNTAKPPKLVRRRENKQSSFLAGRTIGEKREKLQTANERAAARKKDKRKKTWRVLVTIIVFLCLIGVLVSLFLAFARNEYDSNNEEIILYEPTITIIDEDASSGGQITTRMREYIGQVESDLREFNLRPTKAVIPSGTIREVRIYLDGYTGFIKMLVDRSAGVSAEDVSRMLRYLSEIGVEDFEYIDVRIDGKAYWK